MFDPEDKRFKDPHFWKLFTNTEGLSEPNVKFVGKNWAIKRLQSHLPEYRPDDDNDMNETNDVKNIILIQNTFNLFIITLYIASINIFLTCMYHV